MDDYGSFVQKALPSSNDSFLRTLGERLDLYFSSFDFDTNYLDELSGVKKNTHVLCESKSYLALIQQSYQTSTYSYVMKEKV